MSILDGLQYFRVDQQFRLMEGVLVDRPRSKQEGIEEQ